jgi:hypothetical protein
MNKFLLILFIYTCSNGFAQDLNGVWSDSSSTSFKNCYAIFSIQEDSVFMTHYIEFNGDSFVEHGEGTIKNDSLEYHVIVTKKIPGWNATSGDHFLKLSNDGKTLRGYYKDNLNNKGPLVFKRLFPQ